MLADPEETFRVEGVSEIDLTSGGGSGGSEDGGESLVTRARFERATPSFGGWCSIQAELPGHWWDVLGSNQ